MERISRLRYDVYCRELNRKWQCSEGRQDYLLSDDTSDIGTIRITKLEDSPTELLSEYREWEPVFRSWFEKEPNLTK